MGIKVGGNQGRIKRNVNQWKGTKGRGVKRGDAQGNREPKKGDQVQRVSRERESFEEGTKGRGMKGKGIKERGNQGKGGSSKRRIKCICAYY